MNERGLIVQVIRKDAAVTAGGTDEAFPGTFEVILSAPTLDRDGDTLSSDSWKQPLPDHITFDADHLMSVAGTVGSGAPRIDKGTGNLMVTGRFASTPLAQEVRTLVNEGHIRTTSVAFMSEKTEKDGKSVSVRELLNGAFVAIPSNREALVVASKSASRGLKVGARNSSSDQDHIQAIYDHAIALGGGPTDDKPTENDKAARRVKVKSIVGSLEAMQDRARDALEDAYPAASTWLRGTLPDVLVFDLWSPMSGESVTYRQNYTDDGSVVALAPGTAVPVDVAEIVTPDADADSDPAVLDDPAGKAASSTTPGDGEAEATVRLLAFELAEMDSLYPPS